MSTVVASNVFGHPKTDNGHFNSDQKKVHEQVNAKTDFLSHVGTILYFFYFLVGWF